MTKEQKETKKEINLFQNLINKCKYSLQGIKYCLANESSFVLAAIGSCFIIVLGILCDISFVEWVISFGSLALIIIVELLNTAIEATVDMVTLEYNEYAKIAKDCGSAAAGIMSILAVIVNLVIFIPHIIKLIIRL